MSSKSILVSALAVAATLAWQSVSAQAASEPVSREQRKAETAAANKAGQLTPAGQGGAPAAKPGAASGPTVSREQRKAETAAANKAGQLTPAGPGGAPQAKTTQAPSTKTRAERKAETASAAKAGKLTPAGEAGNQK